MACRSVLLLLLVGCASRAVYERRVVADGLQNPRGVLRLSDGSILLAEAGSGEPNSGRLIRLNGAERSVLLDRQPSVNLMRVVAIHRDEIFGFADIAEGGGMILASAAEPKESKIWRLDRNPPTLWATVPGNANSLVYHPRLERWFAVDSFGNSLIELPSRKVVEFPPLEQGQQAVPAAVAYEPSTRALLVALFSGQVGGDTAGSGVDFVSGSGRIVRVDPQSGRTATVVRDLNAPVDLAVDGGALYVLEFCAGFLEPVDATDQPGHGGFERHSGRLLRIDLESGARTVVADRLDLPTNLFLERGGRILVTEGQGTPGRAIPGGRIDGRLIELTQK